MKELRLSRRQVLAAGAAGAAGPVLAALAGVSPVGARPLGNDDEEAPPARAAAPVGGGSPQATDPADLTLVELLPLLERRELAARELVDACIARVERYDAEVKAFKLPTFELARAGAAKADDDRAAGRPVGRLAGVPVGLKDTYYTKGIPTTACSNVLADFVPDFDATVWAKLSAAGAVLLGKLNCTEFAYGTLAYPTRNPWNLDRSPGGSSGGSGAALAARMMPITLGGDTGASIRVPAAICGISGIKPTYGRCSRHGGVPLAWSLDTVGPMTRRMADGALVLQIMAGFDPDDPTTLRAPIPAYPTAPPPDGLKGMRIGVPDRYFWDGIDPGIEAECRKGLARLEMLGAELVGFPMPASTYDVLGANGHNPYGSVNLYDQGLTTAYEQTVLAEATSYHRNLMQARAASYSPELIGVIKAGESVSGPDYLDAQRLRSRWARECREAFAAVQVDAVASPVTPQPSPKQVPTQTFLAGPSFNLCKPWNLNGFPAVSVPVGISDGLPVGLQLASLPLEEPRLLSIAIALDEDVRFFTQHPPLLEG